MRRLLIALPLLAAACTVGPDYQRPSPWSPASWFASRPPQPPALSMPVAEPVDPDWWNAFHDPVLTGLMRRVAGGNLDVRIASLRLAEARAQRGITGADQFPTLNGNTSYTRELPSKNGAVSLFSGASGALAGSSNPALGANGAGARTGAFPNSLGIGAFDLFQAGFDASWELDLWGRVRRAVESADAQVDASTEARRQMLVASLAELARDYIQLRGTQETLRITRDNLASARESASLTAERARGGVATDLDVANARAQLEQIAANIPQLEQQQAQTVNAIALLLGAPPGALAAELLPPHPVPPVPPRVPVGLPSELTRRRPDIRQAEAQLHAATADIGQAEADFFPKVTLAGSVALQTLQPKSFFNIASGTYGLGPSISIPIFEGGRLVRTLELRRAQEREAAVNYQKIVLGAFHDVDNALIAYGAEQRRHDRLAAQAAQAAIALNLARTRFRQGVSDFLEVLTAQRTLLAAQQDLASSTTTISTNLVSLYKALGGGWETRDGPPPE